jgi:hypothetical protein
VIRVHAHVASVSGLRVGSDGVLPVSVARRRAPEHGLVLARVVGRRTLRHIHDAPAEVLLVLDGLRAVVGRYVSGRDGRRRAGARRHRVLDGHGPARDELHEHGGRLGAARVAGNGRRDAAVRLDQRLERLGARGRSRRRRLLPAQVVLRLGGDAPLVAAAAVLGLRRGVSGEVLDLVHHVLGELRCAGALLAVRRLAVLPPAAGGRGGGRFRGGRGRVERRKRRRRMQALGALEHVLPAGHRVDEVVVGQVVPHEPVAVAPALQHHRNVGRHSRAATVEERERTLHKTQPLGRPGVHARHPLASQSVEPVDHVCAHGTNSTTERSQRKDSTERKNAVAKHIDVPRR